MSDDKYNFLFTFILNILVKTIVILIIMLSYLYLYYGPRIKKNINKLIDSYGEDTRFISKDSSLGNYSNSKDILLSYSIVLMLMIFSTIVFYNYINTSCCFANIFFIRNYLRIFGQTNCRYKKKTILYN